MEQTFIRQGSNLELLEKEVRNEDKTSTLCIWGIQKFFDPKQCFRFFCKNFGDHPNLTHICKIKSKPFFLVKFSEDINIEEFNTKFAKNKRIKAKHALENMALEQLNFITIEECSRPAQKKQVFATEQDWEKVKSTKIEDIVEPLHRLPYEEQVEAKIKDISRVIENYNRAFFKDSEVHRLQKNKIQIRPLKLDEFIKCEGQREGYRSKSEFTIGYNLDGEVVVGFNKGSYHNLTITIETPRNVKIISKNTKLIAAVVQNFIRQHLDALQPYDRVKQVGFWRYLTVRESQRTKQSMVVVVCKTQDCDLKLLAQIKQDFMLCMKKSIIGLTSLGFLSYNGQADSVPIV